MMGDISSKLISRVGAKKKNILIWGTLGLLVGGFALSIYSSIDVSGAIEAANKKQDALPELTEMENKNIKQESWAIDMENRLDSLNEEQRNSQQEIANQTKLEIVETNKFMMSEIQRDNKNLMSRIDEIAVQNQSLSRKVESGGGNRNSGGIPLPMGNRIRPMDDNSFPLPGLNSNNSGSSGKKKSPSFQPQGGGDDLLGQINIVPTRQGSGEAFPNANGGANKKRQLFYSKGYTNTFADANKTNSSLDGRGKPKELPTYEVVTGFTEAYMVTGAYAPLLVGKGGGGGSSIGSGGSGGASSSSTGGQTNVPVLLEAQGDAIFPNFTIGSVDKCMLIGTATGNASTATIDIRLDKMTCVLHGGKQVIDGKISGWVVSEVGTPGIPSVMVYRAGDYIARVIASGVLEGISQGFVSAASAWGTGGSNPANSIYTGATTGASTGVSNAFSKLADFYLALAESTLPTLEAKGGRSVSIILNGGDKFTVRDINLLDTREVNRYMNKFVGNGKKK